MAYTVNERNSALYTATILDEDGAVVPAASLESLILTLYDKVSGTVINNRDSQNVLNAANVTVSAQGVIEWEMLPADNIIVSTKRLERHIALWIATWADGSRQVVHQVEIDVTNVPRVT